MSPTVERRPGPCSGGTKRLWGNTPGVLKIEAAGSGGEALGKRAGQS